jgi:hypothetical protein
VIAIAAIKDAVGLTSTHERSTRRVDLSPPTGTCMPIIDLETPRANAPASHRLAGFRAWSLALAVAFVASSAAAADHSVTVTEQVSLAVPPARAWNRIKDFMGWSSWHPAFAGTKLLKGDGHSVGTVRLLSAKDGAQFTEELVAYDPAAHSLTYRILESPAPVIGYVSTISVRRNGSGSNVVWSSRFSLKDGTAEGDAKKAIAAIYRVGLDNLVTSFD